MNPKASPAEYLKWPDLTHPDSARYTGPLEARITTDMSCNSLIPLTNWREIQEEDCATIWNP